MTTNYIKLTNNLEALKLYTIKENLPAYIDMINDGSKTTIDALYELTEKEMNLKEQRAIKACVHTHLATAIGIEAAKHRKSVYFISCQELMIQLKKAENENRLDQRLKSFTRHKLLIIDEIGYINMDKESANLFFQLISRRYEQKSTIITTNKSLAKWNEIFGDSVIANAILDRLLHHSHIVSIIGPSYRVKDVLDALDN